MPDPPSRIPLIIFGFILGAAIGFKTVALPMLLVLGIRPPLGWHVSLALALAWIFSFAVAFAVLAATGRLFGMEKAAERTGDGVRDQHLDG